MDVFAYNRQAERGNRWTVPVGPGVIAAARRGDWQVVLTPTRPVPRGWFPALAGLDLLCLASGGCQQGPVLAAAGAAVTVLDAGFLLAGLYEDRDPSHPLAKFLPTFLATRAVRPPPTPPIPPAARRGLPP
jgi:hypothetical protein